MNWRAMARENSVVPARERDDWRVCKRNGARGQCDDAAPHPHQTLAMVVSHKAPVMPQRPAKTITRSSALCALLLTAASCQGVAPETASADAQGALVGPRQCTIPLPDGPP